MKPTSSDVAVSVRPVLDHLGIVCSCACAVHCAAMPLLLAYLPTWGWRLPAGEGVHQILAVVCLTFALASFIPGYRRHRRLTVPLLGLAGVLVLAAAAFLVPDTCCAEEANDKAATCATTSGHCEDECCQKEDPAEAPSPFAAFAGWLTPLGSAGLVLAHVLNRRCSCACCTRRVTSATNPSE